jgi:hypothetical protein
MAPKVKGSRTKKHKPLNITKVDSQMSKFIFLCWFVAIGVSK